MTCQLNEFRSYHILKLCNSIPEYDTNIPTYIKYLNKMYYILLNQFNSPTVSRVVPTVGGLETTVLSFQKQCANSYSKNYYFYQSNLTLVIIF